MIEIADKTLQQPHAVPIADWAKEGCIARIEPVPRMVYTGSIGYIYKGDLHFNIAIRTILKTGDIYMVNANGGIVADSDVNEEYAEIITRAYNVFAAVSDNF